MLDHSSDRVMDKDNDRQCPCTGITVVDSNDTGTDSKCMLEVFCAIKTPILVNKFADE